MTKWQEVKLDDICKMNTETYSLDENWKYVNYLDTGNITSNKIENIQYIDLSVDKLPSRARRKVKNGNIVYSTVRPNQLHYGLIKEQPDNFLVSTGFAVLDIDTTKAIPEYVYYLLTQASYTEALHAIAEQSTSAYPSIKPSDIGNRKISLPPLEIQKKIAGVLSALDDKIELNNKINNNLEQQAQALFKSWFVDFEPFGGTMPEDWKVGKIGDVCSSISDTYRRNDEKVVLINTSDVLDGNILNHLPVKNGKLKGQFKKTFQKNDILYSEIRPANKRFAYVDFDDTSNYIASTKLMVIRPNKEKIFPNILYRMLKSQDLIDELQHLAETRSGTFPQITFTSELALQPIVLPSLEIQEKIDIILDGLEKKIRHSYYENTKLAALRDALLPKLMSGEIDVSSVSLRGIE